MAFNSPFVIDSLYCSEDTGEDHFVEESCFNKSNPFPILLEQDLLWEDDELSSLLSKEEQSQMYNCLQTNGNLAVARFNAVDWMLKVTAHHSFSALTAVLAVNYLDRFLFSLPFQTDKPWMTQLGAVACLSLAAKVEETQVPLLLDLQVEESKYYFEAKTVQRMEILVLSTLQWKMNPITPISFLHYIARRLGLKGHVCWEFLRRCDQILLSVISDSRFLCYLPSAMATAIMLQVMDSVELEPNLRVQFQNQLLDNLGINKDKVDESCKLIIELTKTREEGNQSKKRRFKWIPESPNGVIDLLFISNESNDSWGVSSPDPVSKKIKTQLLH
ncbi:hypothetical protein Gotri_026200 [Gossypium trilobum]|uniref:Cyclin N-terminal domain-containing protein n=1 Tax=Gossypium trilobum TaxID=34281 RepID=A0A7J9FSE4_9ROSI|nr:hypothetical protein [Gossypium trilobum]